MVTNATSGFDSRLTPWSCVVRPLTAAGSVKMSRFSGSRCVFCSMDTLTFCCGFHLEVCAVMLSGLNSTKSGECRATSTWSPVETLAWHTTEPFFVKSCLGNVPVSGELSDSLEGRKSTGLGKRTCGLGFGCRIEL